MTSGKARTTLVIVGTRSKDRCYASVEEVPPVLRARLHKAIHGGDSATLLIADDAGRQHLENLLYSVPAETPAWRPSRPVLIALSIAGTAAFSLWIYSLLR